MLLLEVLTGQVDPAAAAVQARIRECPTCRQELEDLTRVQQELGETGRQEREILAAATTPEPAALERVRRTLAPEMDAAPPPRIAPRILAALLAAAAFLIVIRMPALLVPREPAGVQFLSGTPLEVHRPQGSVDGYPPFQWSGELPPGGSFVVTVWSEEPEGTWTVWARSPALQGTSWDGPPDPGTWPGKISWEVMVHDVNGNPGSVAEAVASLSSAPH
jgi:hypothetical protein